MLYVNNLHLKPFSWFYIKHHFGMRLIPYQGLKSAILRPNMGLIGP